MSQNQTARPDLTRFAGCTPSEWCLPKDSKKKSRFEKNILIQMTRKTPEPDSLVERMNAIPWAKEFIRDGWEAIDDGPFLGALSREAYEMDARGMTQQLADLVNCFFFTWLRNLFRHRVDEWARGMQLQPFTMSEAFSMDKKTKRFSEELPTDDFEEIKKESRPWRDDYAVIYDAVLESETWRRLGQRVGTFCRHAGCPNATDDALSALGALRNYNIAILRETASWELQVELKSKVAEIQKLKSQLDLYQKAIACLSYRKLFEALPEQQYRFDGTQEVFKATEHWQNFLAAAKRQVEIKGDKEHPLYDLVTNHPRAIKGGRDIYQTLSDNIHGFSQSQDILGQSKNALPNGSEFVINPVHFEPAKVQFLSAVVPMYWQGDGSIALERERKRYGVVWEKDKDNGRGKKQGGFMAKSDPERPSKHIKPVAKLKSPQQDQANQPFSDANDGSTTAVAFETDLDGNTTEVPTVVVPKSKKIGARKKKKTTSQQIQVGPTV